MKTFLSIGTGPGIGYETVARFAKEGYRVIISARHADKLDELADRLAVLGSPIEARVVDVASAGCVAALVNEIDRAYGGVDVLHYNAAAIHQDTVDSQSLETFNMDLAVNIGGALAAIQAIKPKMEVKGSGSILLTGGGFAFYPNPDYLSLSIGKAGLRALVLGLFETCKEKNIHIGMVTVCAFVAPASRETREIGDCFWNLHTQRKPDWTAEMTYPA